MTMTIRPSGNGSYDLVALGEVMLRLDPGEGRIHTARRFNVWEGGAEYNVARGLRRSFGLRTAIVTALADNPIGRLVEDLMFQGGVDQQHVRWVPYDGVGRTVRNGLNFVERGFGIRAGLGSSDRGHTAASQLRPHDVDWSRLFGDQGARWFHTGGVFAGLSETTPLVADEAMACAREHGTIVSYDLNYRESLWRDLGGQDAARRVNRHLVEKVDVLLGNEEDFAAALGFPIDDLDPSLSRLDPASFAKTLERVVAAYPNLRMVAATLRTAPSATRNDWSALCWVDGEVHQAPGWHDIEVLDRVGGGDAFASGLIYGFLSGYNASVAVQYGAASGALAMTTPGDTTMALLSDVERVMAGGSVRMSR